MKALMCRCADKWGGYAPMILRIAVGLVFLMHGWQKINDMGVAGVSGFFSSVGIPAAGFFAVVVMWLEFLGGIGLILGLWTHWFAKLLAIEMIVALFAVHAGQGFFIAPPAYGWEFALVLIAALISLMISGPGRHAIDARWTR